MDEEKEGGIEEGANHPITASDEPAKNENLGIGRPSMEDEELFRDLETALGEQSLYDEAHDSLLSAFFMFFVSDLRDLIKQNLLEGDAEMLRSIVELPCSLHDIFSIFEKNKELLSEKLEDEARAEMYRAGMSLQRFSIVKGDHETTRKVQESIKYLVFSDENEEEEIVYAIATSPVRRRINVSFRGSVTRKDFRQDLRAVLSSIDNPIKDDPDLSEHLGVHLGFREYLYSEDNGHPTIFLPKWMGGGRQEECDGTIKKYQIILKQVRSLVREHPDCQVRVAGHSLGGALAVLFALEAAADDQLPKPVTCITSGAPKVGFIWNCCVVSLHTLFHFCD